MASLNYLPSWVVWRDGEPFDYNAVACLKVDDYMFLSQGEPSNYRLVLTDGSSHVRVIQNNDAPAEFRTYLLLMGYNNV